MTKRNSLPCVGTMLLVGACGQIGNIIDIIDDTPNTVELQFVNTTNFEVQLKLFRSDEDDVPLDLLTSDTLNSPETITVAAGGTATREFACDDIQSMAIEDAELRIIGDIGPKTETDALHDGEEFDCGEVVTFTFSSDIGIDIDVAISNAPQTE